MSKDFPGDYWFKFPHGLNNKLMCFDLTKRESRIFHAILFKTYRWKKYKSRITPTEFNEMTGIKKVGIAHIIRDLINKRIILKKEDFYLVNIKYEQWIQKLSNETRKLSNETTSNIITFGKTGS